MKLYKEVGEGAVIPQGLSVSRIPQLVSWQTRVPGLLDPVTSFRKNFWRLRVWSVIVRFYRQPPGLSRWSVVR